ncbi:MAG: hypothetical protein J4O01_04275 [Chloroflexi bacterium]|nr:hypothetical protein [Chloroflexota bacterium]MCH8114711.1 hypothetical protein [Chloroflexota bacterium]MCI0774252.1 hypothetical protein [Chloroflexota bacterium]MCI0808045.1 hypothetical protein [Chloroflexota bacterium]MCI0833311.1 hypothetical protein [Chloroflexota bacterium]
MAQQIQARLRSFSSVIIGMLFVLISASACGGGSSDQLFQQISDPGQTITVDTLRSTTFKESREYSVEGLPGATYVSYGFLRVGGRDPYEYEIRFYESHRLAVELGTALAIEGTGKTAILNADDATYKEGVKNRRVIIGSGVGGGARSGIGPKFGSYAIFGNIVMLCQGSDKAQSIERCGLLANELIPPVAE